MILYRLCSIHYLRQSLELETLPFCIDALSLPDKPQKGVCAFEPPITERYLPVIADRQDVTDVGDELSIMKIDCSHYKVIDDPYSGGSWKGAKYIQHSIKTVDVSIVGYVSIAEFKGSDPIFSMIHEVFLSVRDYVNSYNERHQMLTV